MIRRPPRSTLFPTRRSSDLLGNRAAVKGIRTFVGEPFESPREVGLHEAVSDRKSTRLNSSHMSISYAVFCLKKKKKKQWKTKIKTNKHVRLYRLKSVQLLRH